MIEKLIISSICMIAMLTIDASITSAQEKFNADPNQQLPDPDNHPPVFDKPVKVFILMGQSNMLGFGRVDPNDKNGTLTYLTEKDGKYPHLVDDDGNWTVRNDVQYVQTTVGNRQHPLTVKGPHIGVELQFGHIMGHIHQEPIVILKACTGNRSLGWDLLPPGSNQFEFEGKTYAGYKESPLSWAKDTTPKPINWYAGKQYDTDTTNAKEVLNNLAKYYPEYKGQGYEVAGFVFWQGHKDQNAAHASRYEQNLVHFIKSLRKDFDAPKAKFVLATIAFGGDKLSGHGLTVANAQLAVSGETGKYPEFKGNVKTIDARRFWRDRLISPSGAGHHYNHNAETYMEVGNALGWAMAELLNKAGIATSGVDVGENVETEGLKFRIQKLHHDLCETCAVGDIDNDRDIDVVAGEYWYSNPDWKQRKFRSIDVLKQGYLADNGDHLLDINRDGYLDVVSGSFFSTTIHWFANPGPENVHGTNEWIQHELANTESGTNEMTLVHDIDGDDSPELFVNSWNAKSPMSIWRVDSDPKKQPLKRTIASQSGNGHGQGFGDINGDGRGDILFGKGWYEQPKEQPFDRRWKLYADFELPNCSCPILVVDLNQDGRNDMIWGNGHDYGLYWDEQLEPVDGSTRWTRHEIDKSFSQAHALAWADLDGDGNRELISGKRFHAHNGNDKGAADPVVMNYYKWDRETESFVKFSISTRAVGTGLQIRTADLNGDRRCDIVVSGKSGTYILWNEGLQKQ